MKIEGFVMGQRNRAYLDAVEKEFDGCEPKMEAVTENTDFWKEKYMVGLEKMGASTMNQYRAGSIIDGFARWIKSPDDIDKLQLSDEANIKPNVIRATLHDFINFIKTTND